MKHKRLPIGNSQSWARPAHSPQVDGVRTGRVRL
ncbi:Hypothetical protein SCLAV_1412 [Streptomyces clavuligerus]|uniref:Uncharacterized protein n=1 Tax=Streptomyces clavuligerus TaxID=1901 RepID=E2Q0U8_STRCL|nr:Hypothetical protein SCLAV_1412 [Streptomyces clavuligerus]